jgi:uncharacterized protein
MNLRSALFAALLLVPSLAGAQATGPQTGLTTQKITFTGHGGPPHSFTVEMALTPQQQEIGLMFRTSVPDGQGMLFDWGYAHEVPMWMKNTLAPLDMVFIGADGSVIHIAEDTVPESLAQISSGGPVRATLELAAGATEKLDIRVGDKVRGAMFK